MFCKCSLTTFVRFACAPFRQMKDQSKKVATLKHKEQVEKNRNAQLMEEARKREDNINESSQQIKVMLALMSQMKAEWVSTYDTLNWMLFHSLSFVFLKIFGLLIWVFFLFLKPPFSPNLVMTHSLVVSFSHDYKPRTMEASTCFFWDTWSHLIIWGLEDSHFHTHDLTHTHDWSVSL